MTTRTCDFPTCDNPFTGPPNMRYCRHCTRRRWQRALNHYTNIVVQGGEPYRLMIAEVYEKEEARQEAARTPRAGAGGQGEEWTRQTAPVSDAATGGP